MEKYDITDYLKDDKELQKAVIDEFLKEIAELKAENIELKERNEKIIVGYIKLSERYKQTLQEIKEFCKKEIEYFDNNDNYGQQADWIALLQKITKAEEE